MGFRLRLMSLNPTAATRCGGNNAATGVLGPVRSRIPQSGYRTGNAATRAMLNPGPNSQPLTEYVLGLKQVL